MLDPIEQLDQSPLKMKRSEAKAYTILGIADDLNQDISPRQKIIKLKEQFEMSAEPNALEIAQAMSKHLRKLS